MTLSICEDVCARQSMMHRMRALCCVCVCGVCVCVWVCGCVLNHFSDRDDLLKCHHFLGESSHQREQPEVELVASSQL